MSASRTQLVELQEKSVLLTKIFKKLQAKQTKTQDESQAFKLLQDSAIGHHEWATVYYVDGGEGRSNDSYGRFKLTEMYDLVKCLLPDYFSSQETVSASTSVSHASGLPIDPNQSGIVNERDLRRMIQPSSYASPSSLSYNDLYQSRTFTQRDLDRLQSSSRLFDHDPYQSRTFTQRDLDRLQSSSRLFDHPAAQQIEQDTSMSCVMQLNKLNPNVNKYQTFRCPITCCIITGEVAKVENEKSVFQYYDYEALKKEINRTGLNPFTRKPLKLENIQPATQEYREAYRKELVNDFVAKGLSQKDASQEAQKIISEFRSNHTNPESSSSSSIASPKR